MTGYADEQVQISEKTEIELMRCGGGWMKLTKIEDLLLRGLMLFELRRETVGTIFALLEKEEEQMAMIDYLAENREATEQVILQELWRIRKL